MKVAILAGIAASCMFLTVSAQQKDTTKRTGRSQQMSKTQQKKPTPPATSRQAGSATDKSSSRAAGGRQKDSLGRTRGGNQTDSLTGRGGRQIDSSRVGSQQRQTDTTQSGMGTPGVDTAQGRRGKTNTDSLQAGGTTQADVLQQRPPVQQTTSAQAVSGTTPTGAGQNTATATQSTGTATQNTGTATQSTGTGAAQQGDRIGKMSVTEFNSLNAKGTQMVKAITPSRGTMSQADQQLLSEVANGGHRQLAISQAVMEKVSNPQVKMLAASEVEEQMAVAMKLKEIAGAMGVTLPPNADSSGQNITAQIQNLSGAQIDSFYLAEGGIKGHELLERTMTTVSSSAKDAALKQLATATLPVIRTHLTISRDLKASTGRNGQQK